MMSKTAPRLYFALAFVTSCGLSAAQTSHAPMTGQQIQDAEQNRDIKLLRGIPKLHVAFVQSAKALSENDGRKIIFDVFQRYSLPVEWTATKSSYAVDVPSVFVSQTVTKTKLGNGQEIISVVVRLELYDAVIVKRNPPVEWHLPIWFLEDNLDVDPATNDISYKDSLRRLAEKFCLSFFAANK
jgi:hypothetical protein